MTTTKESKTATPPVAELIAIANDLAAVMKRIDKIDWLNVKKNDPNNIEAKLRDVYLAVWWELGDRVADDAARIELIV